MSVNSRFSRPGLRPTLIGRSRWQLFLPWLDVVAVLAWSILILRYWLTGKILLLLHPDYVWLAVAASVCLLALGGWKSWLNWQEIHGQTPVTATELPTQHLGIFPAGWGSGLLLAAAILGLVFIPEPFAGHTALQRGVTDSLSFIRTPVITEQIQPQAFRAATRPEDRSLVEWVRTLAVYPEPDAYAGQKAKIQGFVLYPPTIEPGYFMVARFVITCCAADAYPVGLLVKRPEKVPETSPLLAPDRWVEIQGEMATETLNGQRQLVLLGNQLTPIDEPKSPYEF